MRKHFFFSAAISALLLTLMVSPAALAQDEPPPETTDQEECPALTIDADSPQRSRLRELYRFHDICVNERVEIEGTVEQYVEDPAVTTGFYYLSDQFGVWIKVRTQDIASLPELNTTIRLVGIVGYNRVRIDRLPDDWRTAYPDAVRELLIPERGGIYVNEPFLSEVARIPPPPCPSGQHRNVERICVDDPCPNGQVRNADGICEPIQCPPGKHLNDAGDCVSDIPWMLIGIIAAALLLIGLGIALMRTLKARPSSSTGTTTPMPTSTPTGSTPVPSAPTGSSAAAAPQVVEGKTIKMHRPADDKTVKVLPGRFKVIGGLDDITEIRFFMPQGRSTTEITFGRAEGRPYEHIQLKPRTVSSRQAKLVFDGGSYTLHNHASQESNPTMHNGRSLGDGESVQLNDGDRITMGEVEFEYSAS